MHLKGLAYEIDPITPFFGNDEFRRLSPLCRIPVLIDGDFTHQRFLGHLRLSRRGLSAAARPPRRPQGPRPRPLARGICRHAARRPLHLGPVLPEDRPSRRLGRARRPAAHREDPRPKMPPRRSTISKASCPQTAGCSASSASPTSPSPASSATPPTPTSSPTHPAGRASQASSAERSRTRPSPSTLPFEDIQRSVDIKGRRQALLDAGAPLTAETLGTPTPRKGMMPL